MSLIVTASVASFDVEALLVDQPSARAYIARFLKSLQAFGYYDGWRVGVVADADIWSKVVGKDWTIPLENVDLIVAGELANGKLLLVLR